MPAPPLPEPELDPDRVPPPAEPDVPPALGAAPPLAPVGAAAEPLPEPVAPAEPVAPLDDPPLPVAPPLAAPPLAADGAPDEPEVPLDGAAAEGEPLEEDDAVVPVVEVVEVVVLPVAAGAALIVVVGTVNCGALEVSVEVDPPPQAASPRQRATAPAMPAIRPRGLRRGTALGPITARRQMSSGSMRRPQCGQSLRSFWHSWSHQLQKRRFSTDHGSSDGVGARGRSCATTSSGSPVSRST